MNIAQNASIPHHRSAQYTVRAMYSVHRGCGLLGVVCWVWSVASIVDVVNIPLLNLVHTYDQHDPAD